MDTSPDHITPVRACACRVTTTTNTAHSRARKKGTLNSKNEGTTRNNKQRYTLSHCHAERNSSTYCSKQKKRMTSCTVVL